MGVKFGVKMGVKMDNSNGDATATVHLSTFTPMSGAN